MKKKIIGVLGAMLLSGLLFAGGSAFASHDDPGTMHACVRGNRAPMRWVQSPDDCKRREFAVSWAGSVSGGLVNLERVYGEAGYYTDWYSDDFITVEARCDSVGGVLQASWRVTTTSDSVYSTAVADSGQLAPAFGWIVAGQQAEEVAVQTSNGRFEISVMEQAGDRAVTITGMVNRGGGSCAMWGALQHN